MPSKKQGNTKKVGKNNRKKIAFVINFGFIEPFGVLYLCSVLKQHNYMYDIILLRKDYLKEIKEYKPDIVAYNTIMGTQDKFLQVNREIKSELSGVFSIFGGVYPTIVQDMIHEEGVDAICVGEGEGAIIDLMKVMNEGGSLEGIKNLHYKSDGKVITNPLRPLVEDLDKLPFPERDVLYSKNKMLREIIARRFFSKRGCPFNCNYCFNPNIRKVYKKLGTYFRTRSADNIIQEIEEVIRKYPSPTIHFQDDTFTVNNTDWIKEFAEKYRQKINLPFTCLIRIGTFDYPMLKALRNAGLHHVLIGVETASEDIRKNVLGRSYTNEKVIDACKMLKSLGIKFRTLNMLGLPTGGLQESIETLKFNIKLKPYSSQATIFQPYPGTSISNYLKTHGYLPNDFNPSEAPNLFRDTKLNFGNPEEGKQIVVFQRFFSIINRFPFLEKFIPILIKLPDNPLFVFISQLNRGYELFRVYRKGMTLRRLYNYVKYFFNARELI